MGNPCEFELTGYSRSKPPAPPQNARGPIELIYINQYVTLVFRDAHADTGKRRRRGGEWLRDLPLAGRGEGPAWWSGRRLLNGIAALYAARLLGFGLCDAARRRRSARPRADLSCGHQRASGA